MIWYVFHYSWVSLKVEVAVDIIWIFRITLFGNAEVRKDNDLQRRSGGLGGDDAMLTHRIG
jgi:hypothetical protein